MPEKKRVPKRPGDPGVGITLHDPDSEWSPGRRQWAGKLVCCVDSVDEHDVRIVFRHRGHESAGLRFDAGMGRSKRRVSPSDVRTLVSKRCQVGVDAATLEVGGRPSECQQAQRTP